MLLVISISHHLVFGGITINRLSAYFKVSPKLRKPARRVKFWSFETLRPVPNVRYAWKCSERVIANDKNHSKPSSAKRACRKLRVSIALSFWTLSECIHFFVDVFVVSWITYITLFRSSCTFPLCLVPTLLQNLLNAKVGCYGNFDIALNFFFFAQSQISSNFNWKSGLSQPTRFQIFFQLTLGRTCKPSGGGGWMELLPEVFLCNKNKIILVLKDSPWLSPEVKVPCCYNVMWRYMTSLSQPFWTLDFTGFFFRTWENNVNWWINNPNW